MYVEIAPAASRRTEAADPFRQDLVALIPSLRAYAIMLTGSAPAADDLVQDGLVKALRFRAAFKEGSNLRAWLFTILRNHFLSEARRASRMRQDVDGILAGRLTTPASQDWTMQQAELLRALQVLPVEQREALTLVGAGATYEDIAEITGCPLGTVKSRVNRARAGLLHILEGPPARLRQVAGPPRSPAAARGAQGATELAPAL